VHAELQQSWHERQRTICLFDLSYCLKPSAVRAVLTLSSWRERILRSRSSWLSSELRLAMRGIVLGMRNDLARISYE
jgi:hypothetical protein